MRLNIISDTERRIPRKKIEELISVIEDGEEPPDSIVNIVFINDIRMARLNEEYRKKTGSTDVLSFNIDNDSAPNSILGEIYISSDTAARNAINHGVSLTEEFLRLCCHGFLHLLGYDHERENDRTKMERLENYYLEKYYS